MSGEQGGLKSAIIPSDKTRRILVVYYAATACTKVVYNSTVYSFHKTASQSFLHGKLHVLYTCRSGKVRGIIIREGQNLVWVTRVADSAKPCRYRSDVMYTHPAGQTLTSHTLDTPTTLLRMLHSVHI